ncbi:hypothetical protein LCGC14_2970290 [marine sediment metagenome]|uniref:Uncharacterized protein n=1 Tax=marine sediment metagenome TaxID=412755 RepID=A0A0F8XAI8_9ZZZZ
MDNKFKVLTINFKIQHKELYEWIKDHCNSKGITLSHLVRDLITKYKKDVEGGENE